MRRITLQAKERTHMMLKLLAVFEGKHLNEVTEEALEEFISSRADTLKSLLDSSRDRLTVGATGVVLSILTNNQVVTVQRQPVDQIIQANAYLVEDISLSTAPMDNIRLIGDPIIGGNHGISRLNIHQKT
jgi:hypothetical protein